MEHGFQPGDILSLTPDELAVYQELNREQRRQDIKEAVLEAAEVIAKSIFKK